MITMVMLESPGIEEGSTDMAVGSKVGLGPADSIFRVARQI